MATSAGSRLAPPPYLSDQANHRRLMGAYLREAHFGHLGNVGSITLSVGVALTPVVDTRVGPNSCICFMPTTANAAQEQGNGTMYVSSRSAEGFTIAHANTATADRAYSYCILG